MVLFIANTTKFSISCAFASGMWTIAKFTLFYKLSCVLVASGMNRLIDFLFKNLINAGVGWDLRISGACLCVSSAALPALIALGRVKSHSQRSLSGRELSLVPHTIISFIRESRDLSNSHSELNFFNSVTKSWKFWPSCCLYVKNLWQRMVIFFLGLQYSENLCRTGANFISSPGSKVKVSYISLPFWPMHVRKMEVFISQPLVSFSVAAK